MIKFEDAGPKDLLPSNWVDIDEIAISYAIHMALNELHIFQERTKLYANLENMPDEILDLMALELRTQYYDETIERDKKVELIRNTLAWYEKAGTVSAVEQMVATVFSGANVIEWQNMPDDKDPVPGTFAVEVIDNDSAGDRYKELREIIKNVKMASAHLAYIKRIIEIILSMDATNKVYLSKVTFGMKFPYWNVYRLDGSWPLDGSVRLNGLTIAMPVDMKIMLKIQGMGAATMAAVPVMVVRAILDKDLIPMTKPKMSLGFKFPYYYGMHYLDGSWPLNGKVSLKGLTILMPVKIAIGFSVSDMDESDIKVEVTSRRDVWYLDGTSPLDGTKKLDALNNKEEL